MPMVPYIYKYSMPYEGIYLEVTSEIQAWSLILPFIHFGIEVPRRQDDERNNIFLELMQDGGSTERPALFLGSVETHLYEIIQVCIKIYIFSPSYMGTHTCNPGTCGEWDGRYRQDSYEFKVILGLTVTSRPTWAMWDIVSKKTKTN